MIKKRMLITISVIAIIVLFVSFILNLPRFGKSPSGERLKRVQASTNYRNGSFQNESITPTFSSEESTFTAFYKMMFGKKERLEPIDSITFVKTNLKELDPNKNYMVWLGHSSYFMQLDGKRILVDPVLSGYASPFSWIIKAFKGTNEYTAKRHARD